MLRNKETGRFALLFAVITAVTAAAGFALQPAAGLLALGSAAAFGAAFFSFTALRYKRLAELAEQIDLVLHNADRLCIAEAEEGELAVLQSEIVKMTLRIREQNDALKKEKQHLADSMADIAHQLRTPLTSAQLILTLVKNTDDKRERKALLREAEGLFGQVDWLLTALLKCARLDAGIVAFQREPVGLRGVADEALRPLLIPLELRGIEAEVQLPAGLSVTGDAAWLAEAVRNILKNCMESVGSGGRITLSGRDTPLFAELVIRDSGPGFAPEELHSLFDRFYRGKGSGGAGYGIGLSLCRSIVARMGGTVTAKNHPQGGAVFTLRFPK